jgi:NAD(P)-dependent dehydrogenase (short-subunit alcohol dehydrogenase family)
MSLKGKTVVVLGATGNVGAAVVELFDKEGAIVFGTSRSSAKFESVREEYGWSANVKFVEDIDFDSDDAAEAAAQKVWEATGGELLHVVNNIGLGTVGKTVLETTTEDIEQYVMKDFLPSFRASKEFVKLLGQVEGSTVTISSGGFGYGLMPGMSKMYGASAKNALLNNLASCFNAAIVDNGLKVKCQVIPIFFSISRKGQDKNQLGFPSEIDSGAKVAQAYLALTTGKRAGHTIDVKTIEDAIEVGKDYE